MKLRALTLTNIRQFARKQVAVTDLSDGLNVIAEPNEFGKSTLLDALHALFFAPHTGRNAQIAGLAPPSGGAIGVSALLDHRGRSLRVTKQWLSGRTALVADAITGTPIAQGDLAERWLADLMGDPASGPAGLIWVRQGQTGLIPDTRGERDQALAARRTVLSAVAGEVDQLTGGRRFDMVMSGVQAALARLVTATGKPLTGGPWKDVQDRIRDLTDSQGILQRAVADLAGALQDRAQATDRLARLDDPAWTARLQQDLDLARRHHDAAEDHARRLASAAQDLKLAQLTAEQAAGAVAAHQDIGRAAAQAIADLAAARDDQARLQDGLGKATQLVRQAEAARGLAETALAALQEQDRAAQVARAAVQARDHLRSQQTVLDRAQSARTRHEQAAARAAQNPATVARLAALDQAVAALTVAEAGRRAARVTVTVTHLGTDRLTGPAGPLPDGLLPVTAPVTLTLPGALRLTVDPGAQGDPGANDALARAAVARDSILTDLGVATLAEARLLGDARARDMAEAATARTEFDTLAPQGLPPLLADTARLSALAVWTGDSPDPPDPALVADAQDRLRAAQASATAAAGAAARAAMAAHAAGALVTRLEQQADLAVARRGDAAAHMEMATDLTRKMLDHQARLGDLRAAHGALMAAAPDATLTRAAVQRATAACEAHARDRAQATHRIATANGTIAARADDAVQERLDDVTGQLSALIQQEQALAAEVAALTHLRATLAAVRADQQAAYFGPIQAELAPLLQVLHGQAALSFDPAALTPGQLLRSGRDEPFDTLSGGTQEQIAILTRLAFARLLARAGRPAPVILDDALVFSDDDRIGRMFTALHHVAADLQIIVLTCRQLAFQRLGGHRPTVTITPMD